MNRLIFLLLMSLLVASCETYREPPKGVVTLEVGLDYAYGGIQPVARQEFYLLNGNLNELLPAKMELRDLTAFVEVRIPAHREHPFRANVSSDSGRT